MELFKNFELLDALYLSSLAIMFISAVYMPWTNLPITGGIEFLNNNAVSIVIVMMIFLFALFFVDDKLSALLNALFVFLALAFIIFHFFNFGGFVLDRPMLEEGARWFDYLNYGPFVFSITSIISVVISYLVFAREDEE